VREHPHRAAVWLAVLILLIALAVHLLLPQLAGLEASGRALARARRWWLLPLALGLEAASLLAYAELVRTVLRAAGQPVARGLVQRVTVAGYALGRTLPGGSVAALAVVATELRGVGLPAATTAAALTASGLLSAVVLALLLLAGVAPALLTGEGAGIALGVAGLAVLLVIAALVAHPTLQRPRALGRLAERFAAVIARGPLRRRLDPVEVGGQITEATRAWGSWSAVRPRWAGPARGQRPTGCSTWPCWWRSRRPWDPACRCGECRWPTCSGSGRRRCR